MSDSNFDIIVETLKQLKEDPGIPKNVKSKINDVIDILQGKLEKSIKVDKAMHIFDEFSDDSNIDPFTRTQLWNVVSSLESL